MGGGGVAAGWCVVVVSGGAAVGLQRSQTPSIVMSPVPDSLEERCLPGYFVKHGRLRL